MNYSATRLTLYALLSSLEEDLRELLLQSVPATYDLEKTLGGDLFQKTFERFQKENGEGAFVTSLEELLPYLDFPEAFELICANKKNLPRSVAQPFIALVPKFQKLTAIRNRVAHSRPLNFEDLPLTLDTLESTTTTIPFDWKNLTKTQERLKDNPGEVLTLTLPESPEERIFHNLPVPDFDETGFMGRTEQLTNLQKMLRGPYPVVSIIGEGGLGKSALAVKIAYEILEDTEPLFDYIIWSSAKSATITASEIKRIENTITNSLGMFQVIEDELSGTETEEPIEEILGYLTEFRILLILDNLETIIDDSLFKFFDQLPIGSKVLTTSRIGLGEFERRLNLSPMKHPEAAQLLRSLSKTRGITQLSDAPQAKLNDYCHKLKNNPGFIKWFVACFQSGRRPEQILQNTDIFLEFCLSNVHEYLSQDSKRLLTGMLVVSRPLSIPELAYILNMQPERLQRSIHQLLQTNMLSMLANNEDGTTDTRFSLSELARAYLTRIHPASETEYRRLRKVEKELSNTHDEAFISNSENSASIYKIATRTKGDRIIVKYLVKALNFQKEGETEEALKIIEDAKKLSPGYYEVHRVEAWIFAQSGNIAAAKNSYQAALELEDRSANLHIWYSGFVQRYESDLDLALTHIQKAEEILPNNAHARLEKSRILLHQRKFEEAEVHLEELLIRKSPLGARLKRMAWDLSMQIPSWRLEYSLKKQDYLEGLNASRAILDSLGRVPREFIDERIQGRLGHNYSSTMGLKRHLVDEKHEEDVDKLLEDYRTEMSYIGFVAPEKMLPRDYGTITALKDKFGFLSTNDSSESLYFSFASIKSEEKNFLKVGTRLEFSIGHNRGGMCAVDCKIV